MSSIWVEVFTQIIRGILTSVGAYLVRRGWVETTLWTQFVTDAAPGIALAVVGVAWIINAEIRKRRETLVARDLPPGTPLTTIAMRAKSMFAPSVRNVSVLLLILLPFAGGCAGSNWLHVATIANDKTAIGVQALQTEVVRGHTTMCGPQKCISDRDYDRLQAKFAAAGRVGDAFTTALDHADKQDAMTQAGALLTFVNDVITNDVPNLPDNIKIIVSASLSSAKVALAAFATPPAK